MLNTISKYYVDFRFCQLYRLASPFTILNGKRLAQTIGCRTTYSVCPPATLRILPAFQVSRIWHFLAKFWCFRVTTVGTAPCLDFTIFVCTQRYAYFIPCTVGLKQTKFQVKPNCSKKQGSSSSFLLTQVLIQVQTGLA